MIGLGSNRLTVCRRGGMSVRQAGRGGMEWLAGGRWPSWASPYSAQATAALKEQFPTQWQTIRDYGVAHPEIVGYMNAYAPEDAKIAYSLVEGIGTRWLVGDGTAYINTGLVPTSAMNYRLVGKNSNMASGSFAGSRNVGFGGIIFGMKVIDYFPTNPSSSTRWTFNQATAWSRMEYVIREGVAKVYTNDVLLGEHTFTNYGGTTTRTFHLFEINNDGAHGTYAVGMSIALVEIENSREMYPFIRKINGVETCGMIDVLSGTFYQNAGSGSFTISETPAS